MVDILIPSCTEEFPARPRKVVFSTFDGQPACLIVFRVDIATIKKAGSASAMLPDSASWIAMSRMTIKEISGQLMPSGYFSTLPYGHNPAAKNPSRCNLRYLTVQPATRGIHHPLLP